MGRILTRLPDTTGCIIAVNCLVMNLEHLLRVFFFPFFKVQFWSCFFDLIKIETVFLNFKIIFEKTLNILEKIMDRFTELSVDNSIGLEPLIDYTNGILYDINKYRKMFSLYLYTMNCYFNTVTTEEYELFQGIMSQWGILLQLFIKIRLSININLLEKVLAIFS